MTVKTLFIRGSLEDNDYFSKHSGCGEERDRYRNIGATKKKNGKMDDER